MFQAHLDAGVWCRMPKSTKNTVWARRINGRSHNFPSAADPTRRRATFRLHSRSRSHSLVLHRHLSLSGAQSTLINNAYPRARTGEKSTAVATRRASPRTPAIAHTYLYTVIFKMKERRAGGVVVVVVSCVRGRWITRCHDSGDQEGPYGWRMMVNHIFTGLSCC